MRVARSVGPVRGLALGALLGLTLVAGCGRFGDSAADHLVRAAELRAKGDAKGSLIELKNALQKEPDNAQARFQIGEAYLQEGDLAGAQKELNHALNAGLLEATLPLARTYVATQSWDPLSDLKPAEALPAPVRAEVLALQARGALAGGDQDGAHALVEQARALDAKSAPVLFSEAALAIGNKDQALAERQLAAALEADPNYADALVLRADLAAQKGDMAAAEADYSRVIALRPAASASELLKRGMVRMSLKKLDDARKDADTLKKWAPEHPGVAYLDGLLKLSAGDYVAAQTAFELALSKAQDYLPVIFYLGAVHAAQDHLEQADYYLGNYLNRAPGSAAAARLAAGVKVRRNDIEGATAVLEQAAAANPKDAVLHDLLGRIYASRGDPKGIEMLKEAVALQPDSAALRERLGIAMLLGGQQSEAQAEIDAAARLDPDARQGKYLLVITAMRERDFERALTQAQALQASYPDDVTVWNLLGGIHLAKNDSKKAMEAFEQALRIKPDSVAATNNLGQLKAGSGDVDGAVAVYRDGLKHAAGNAAISPRLAGLLLAQKKPDEAVQVLADAVKANPSNTSLRIVLARVQYGLGKQDEAAKTLQEGGDKSADLQIAAGDLALAKKDFPTARVHYEAAAKLDERSAAPLFMLGQVERQDGKPEVAEKRYRDALIRETTHQPARTALVSLLLAQRDVSGALAVVDDAERQGLKAGYLQALRGDIAAVQNNREAALDAYGKALAMEDSRTHRMALARAQVAYGKVKDGVATLEGWLAKNPQDAATRHVQLNWQVMAGNTDAAVQGYDVLLKANDKDVLALNNLAMLLRGKDQARAVDLARKAAGLAPKSPAVMDTLALLLMDGGDLSQARKLLEGAVEAAPKATVLQLHLAQVQAKAGDNAAARASLHKLLENDAKFPERAEAEALLASLK
ncbi:MAG: XrtA/PEP-CTERM system TPR-repeat protein PrsT [Immundisolibacter sp.]|uniref:XrtA/PEP-CTERM system TPR-repeat protein PrsT n=1 Tax=Immundisolibacter sp. TaxID=1934948 RepID=UPI003D0E8180